MESSYLPVLIFFAGGMAFIASGWGISLLIQTRKPNPQKLSFYECGEEFVPVQNRFNLRFLLPAVVFLLMEAELVLMAPVMLNRKGMEGLSPSDSENLLRTEMLIFLLLLGAGFLLALGLRYFDWAKPASVVPGFQGPVSDNEYLGL
jgi:NADH-quinone oxidoreductase subunit A